MANLVDKFFTNLKSNGISDTAYHVMRYLEKEINIRLEKKEDYLKYESKTDTVSCCTEKDGFSVFIVAGIPYYDIGGGQRCSQLAKTFNKMGYTVRYLYSNYSQDKKKCDFPMPLEMHAMINKASIKYVKQIVKKDDLFIFEAPSKQFEGLLDIAIENECKIIYENIDNWETSLGNDVFNEKFLKKILLSAHLLVGTAKPLVEQLKVYMDKFDISQKDKKILYLPNAVDETLFCNLKVENKPKDLIQGEKTFLYYGSLWGEWFCWDLVIGLAEKHPAYSINLIGNYESIRSIVEKCPSNIHFLGLKAQTELPAYLQHVDYALLPFDRGEIGDYVSPLKIFEYISMHKRVLSTSLPDIQGYYNVYCGDTVEEWEQIIEQNYPIDAELADAFIEGHTWSHRVSTMLQNLYEECEYSILKNKLSIVILNYNNKNIIFKCINSLLRYRELYNYEIIVVDNGSSDGSYELLQKRYTTEEIALYRNVKNGCASGRNLGVSKATKEYVMFLDSDQWIYNKYWLRPYEQIMKVHNDFGCIGWAAGFFNPKGGSFLTVDFYPLRYMSPKMLCRTDIGYLGSGGMLMKISDFHEIEGFDTFYDPTCYEDTDISLKIRHANKEIYYCPYLGVVHLPHQTTNAGSDAHIQLTIEKREYFIKKWKKINPDLLKYTK